VRWYLGGDGWHDALSWPPPQARESRLYLGDAAAATAGAAGGSLRSSPPTEESAAQWTHDPRDLVPSTVENPFAFLRECPDEREVEARRDVLTFTGEPLSRPLDLTGPVTARLRVTTDGPSMHVFAKLVDVFPDGRAVMLLRGQISTAEPDGAHAADVYLGHTGYRVEAGHRLRLHVASSDFPLYVAHAGTDANPWFATTTRTNRQTLVAGGSDSSHVSVTVLDSE
jgi:putative CocE/NonD family hydrolase